MATDLSVLVDAIAAANRKGRASASSAGRGWSLCRSSSRSATCPRPDPPDLPDPPDRPGAPDRPARSTSRRLPYGLTDSAAPAVPGAAHPRLLGSATHTVVAYAGPAAGRVSLLRTLKPARPPRTPSPADVHIYGIDCGTGALLPVADLPHCGAVVTREQGDRVERLLTKLRNEIGRRQQLLAAQGFAGLAEQRAATSGADRLPWMLLLLDWWEGYVMGLRELRHTAGWWTAWCRCCARAARPGCGPSPPPTGRRCSAKVIGAAFSHRMVFRMTDRDDASLAEIPDRSLPAHQPRPTRVMYDAGAEPARGAGRAARRRSDRARPGGGDAPDGRGGKGEVPAQAARRHRPLRVDALPSDITARADARAGPGLRAAVAAVGEGLFAGGDELAPQGLDLDEEGSSMVVAVPAAADGRPRS